jgi:hypothetical protein
MSRSISGLAGKHKVISRVNFDFDAIDRTQRWSSRVPAPKWSPQSTSW